MIAYAIVHSEDVTIGHDIDEYSLTCFYEQSTNNEMNNDVYMYTCIHFVTWNADADASRRPCVFIFSCSNQSKMNSHKWNLDSMIYYQIEGTIPKGPYLSCVSVAGRALLAGYPRYDITNIQVFIKQPTL